MLKQLTEVISKLPKKQRERFSRDDFTEPDFAPVAESTKDFTEPAGMEERDREREPAVAAGGGGGGGLGGRRWRDTDLSAGLGDGKERESFSRWKRERERERGSLSRWKTEREREREGDRKNFAQAGKKFPRLIGCPGFLRGNPVAPIAKSLSI